VFLPGAFGAGASSSEVSYELLSCDALMDLMDLMDLMRQMEKVGSGKPFGILLQNLIAKCCKMLQISCLSVLRTALVASNEFASTNLQM